MNIRKYWLAAAALAALTVSPALAYEPGTWILRAGVGMVSPDSNNLVINDGTTTTTIDVDEGTSLTLTATYMFTSNWAFDILAAYPFNHDIQLSITDNANPGVNPVSIKAGETDHLPPTFSVQYHFAPDATFQPYAGVGVNWTTFFDTDVTQDLIDAGINDLSLDDSFGLALQLGGDWAINDSWSLNFDLRWIDIESDADVGYVVPVPLASEKLGTVKIDPWVYAINLGYRF